MASKISTIHKIFSEMKFYEILGYLRCVDEVFELTVCPEPRNLMKTLIYVVPCIQCEECSSFGKETGKALCYVCLKPVR